MPPIKNGLGKLKDIQILCVHVYSVKSTIVNIFKPGICQLKAEAYNWFLKLLLSVMSLCVHVYVCVHT